MKLITFQNKAGESRTGWLQEDAVVDMNLADSRLPVDMLTFIDNHEANFKIVKELGAVKPHYSLDEVKLLAPLPNPRSFRDYIGFEQHMLNASKSFGHTIGQEWYEMPIFYFTNHHAIYGPEDEIQRPDGEEKLDIELEIACIIGKKGKNIKVDQAQDYIFGYTVFNDWTARAIQRREMLIPLGPHKGKDFANAIGPCIVTKDEMDHYLGDSGKFNLRMTAKINGTEICDGNYNTVHYTFGQMIARAAENNVHLMPGDILGSGTVGWGSLIENNFSVHRPLEPGDQVELEIEGIGILRNKVV
jgi:2-keto-4-pentenoate hydratase/2-oxohepta-3-ene-1,7-dioic acid hydratase in catechol pathway